MSRKVCPSVICPLATRKAFTFGSYSKMRFSSVIAQSGSEVSFDTTSAGIVCSVSRIAITGSPSTFSTVMFGAITSITSAFGVTDRAARGASNSCTSSGVYMPLRTAGKVARTPSEITRARSICRGYERQLSLPPSPAALARAMSQSMRSDPPAGWEKVALTFSFVWSCHSTRPPDCWNLASIESAFREARP